MTTVVLSHGWDGGTDIAERTFQTLRPRLEAAGCATTIPDLGNDNYYNANVIGATINLLPVEEKVLIIAHSMGGLSALQYLKALGGYQRVATFIAIDSPLDGVGLLSGLFTNWQMLTFSSFMKQLRAGTRNPKTSTGSPHYTQLTAIYPNSFPDDYRWQAPNDIDHRHICHYEPAIAKCLEAL